MKIYLDACCLSRPFDDQSQQKVYLESQAILFILSKCRRRELELIGSEAIDFETGQITSEDKCRKVRLLAELAREHVVVNDEIEKLAREFRSRLKIDFYDAVHLACAKKGKVNLFFTTDEKLLKKVWEKGKIIGVNVVHPVEWLMIRGGF